MRQKVSIQQWLQKIPSLVPLWAGLVVLMLVLAAVKTYPPLWPAQDAASTSLAFFSQGEDKVAVNTAPVEELMLLPGIGEEKAQAIIDWREANGDFAGAQDLLQVPGIGPGTLEKIQDLVCF